MRKCSKKLYWIILVLIISGRDKLFGQIYDRSISGMFNENTSMSLLFPGVKHGKNKIIKEQKRTPPTEDKIYIDFVGTGDIQKSISQGDKINANTGLGVIFERFSGFDKILQSVELESILNIATTSDSIVASLSGSEISNRRDFGTYILNPVSAKQSFYLNSNIYFGYPQDCPKYSFVTKYLISGMNFRVISSNNVWTYNESHSNLGSMYLRAGVFREFVPDNYRIGKEGVFEGRSRYSIFLGLNYSYRAVLGDISSERYDELRTKFLGNKDRSFNGVECNFGFKLNNLRAEFQMPILKNESKFSIEGLTNTQFLFSIKFIGGFGLKLSEKAEASDDNL